MDFRSDSGGSGLRLEASAQGPLQGELWGALESATLAQLESALRRQEPCARRLLVRLERVTGCGPGAQARWEQLHRWLAQAGWRTAYLDARPWGRGLALAVVHRAQDPLALPVGTEAQALAWLAAQGTRLARAQALAEPPGGAAR